MCVSIRAPAQDLIISSVYQRAKTLSRSTAARFEVNLHNGPMFALSWARALSVSVSVGTVMSWEHRGRDAHSRWLILESDAQLAPGCEDGWLPAVRVSGKMLLGWKLSLYGYKKKKDMDVECSSCRCSMLKGTGVSFVLLCLMAEVSLSAQQVLRIGE